MSTQPSWRIERHDGYNDDIRAAIDTDEGWLVLGCGEEGMTVPLADLTAFVEMVGEAHRYAVASGLTPTRPLETLPLFSGLGDAS